MSAHLALHGTISPSLRFVVFPLLALPPKKHEVDQEIVFSTSPLDTILNSKSGAGEEISSSSRAVNGSKPRIEQNKTYEHIHKATENGFKPRQRHNKLETIENLLNPREEND